MDFYKYITLFFEMGECFFRIALSSCPVPRSESLWELAAAEVRVQESEGGEAAGERSVFLIGSKAGVC